MRTNFELKEEAVAETPLLLFDCELRDGTIEHWSTHAVTVGAAEYEPRVLRHNVFEVQAASDQGVDSIPRIALTLANADSHFSELERRTGWKGAKVTVRFVFFDVVTGVAATESTLLFQGIANPPEEITEAQFRLSAINRMSLQRVLLPEVRIQRRCPWEFPVTRAQREEAVDGGSKGRYSRYYRCGYSADVPGGKGLLDGTEPFASCGYTRADCEARGMFAQKRFGGIEFVPSSIAVRSYGEKGWHAAAVDENTARYNDFVPLVYGTAWYAPPVVFARNDGNLTRMEALLGIGEIEGVLKVLVNDVEIPLGQAGSNMTGTGWYNVVSVGARDGGFNLDFPGGDPYGSMAYVSVVVPNRISDGNRLPNVKTLVNGLKLAVYAADGSELGVQFTNNPAWIVLDVLRRCGWGEEEIDLRSFAAAAAFCAEAIEARDLHGNTISVPRFQCNLAILKRRSAGDAIRGIRNGSRMFLTYGEGGLLEARIENTMALQQRDKAAWSNAASALEGGWPSYEFGDGTSGTSGILRRDSGEASVRVWSRSTIDTPNRFATEFQDALNEYQQDSYSLVDVDDVALAGQEITAPLAVLGIANFDQAARIVKFYLDKSIGGNTYVDFETSVKALGLRPGDLITITYLKEGFERQPFRIVRIAPGMNYRTAAITAQIHRDDWYSDTNGQAVGGGAGREPGAALGAPRPLIGPFTISESAHDAADGSATVEASVNFDAPAKIGGLGSPLISLSASVASGGTLQGGRTLYYAVSAVDADGRESALSFIVRVTLPAGAGQRVTLVGLSFPKAATSCHVYRGANPMQMARIASGIELASEFTDDGFEEQAIAPPDGNYDHANFYWRLELQPESPATIHSANEIGNDALLMTENRYRGMTVRITSGRGTGQERPVIANTGTTLSVSPDWITEPDATSRFVISESAWRFGATCKSSSAQFEIPNRTGTVLQVSGRSANALDVESPSELAPVTRWTIGGAGMTDADVPPPPAFMLGLGARGGSLELASVGFEDLTNTRTITSGTLTVHYWNEIGGAQVTLAVPLGPEDTAVPVAFPTGSLVQVDQEILRVEDGGVMTRGVLGTAPAVHGLGTAVYRLISKVFIVPFPRGFFGSSYSGNWSYPIPLANARVAAAELFLTNAKGSSEAASMPVTQNTDNGLRTLSGGQYSFQVDGYLSIDAAAAPELVVEESRAVRDVFAVVRMAPAGGDIVMTLKQAGEPYCTVTIPAGATISGAVDGFALGPLRSGSRVSLEISEVGADDPGADLTVVVRL